ISPSSVYARTGDFKLDVNGDKFTPESRITIDGSELPTRFINAQQLSTTVPAAFIAGEGAHSISVHTPDGKLFSNVTSLSVMAAPTPNYSFVGILGKVHFNDTAVVQDKNSKDLLNVQRGDILGGRFRVTSISERELVLVDTTLRIKHTIPFTVTNANSGPQPRQQRPPEDDEEP
ncbi:MAG: IPT/TIG domain-containing protein, partial [Pyrinomonadaceae bacterium]